MDLTNQILSDTREAVGLSIDDESFDTDILMHINAATGTLNQAGIGMSIVVTKETTWSEFKNPVQENGNKSFHMIPLFITLSTKLLFDPPPPSSAQYHADNIDKLLWRLKFAYEEYTTSEK